MLKNIQPIIMKLADSVSAAMNVEVGLTDEDLTIIAGTGSRKKMIGKNYTLSSFCYVVLQNGDSVVVTNHGQEEWCQKCPFKNNCSEIFNIMEPIKFSGKTIGVIELFATTEKQKKIFENEFDRLVFFTKNISLMISSILDIEQRNLDSYSLLQRTEKILDLTSEGLIVINENGCVTSYNASSLDLLQMSAKEIQLKLISDVFSGLDLGPDYLRSLDSRNPIALNDKRCGNKYYVSYITPINNTGYNKEYLLSFNNRLVASEVIVNSPINDNLITLDSIIGNSSAINKLKEKVINFAKSDSTVLITGESGTGKELFAKAIHTLSSRADMPFIAINCAAIPEALIEAELFGYEDGAFTGAKKGGKPGKFELANRGTLLLDELGEMPIHMQIKLLRVLEERVLDRVGGVKPKPIDVRVIATTNRDLEDAIETGEFRKDLFYRLCVIPLEIPPLRERADDIEILADYFRVKHCNVLGKNIQSFTPLAVNALLDYHWPGNVRELENAIEYAINIEEGNTIDKTSLPPRILNSNNINNIHKKSTNSLLTFDQAERELIVNALLKYGTDGLGKRAAAKELKIGIATLYRKMKLYNI